jgi:uncharacterized protein YdaL
MRKDRHPNMTLEEKTNRTRYGLDAYKLKVRRDHKTRLVRASFSLYAWFWFHTEFWLQPIDRRPYTYIMRDWIFPHKNWFWLITAIWFPGMVVWSHWNGIPATIIGILTAMLWAHLVWGSKWKEGEQEWPPYLGTSSTATTALQ